MEFLRKSHCDGESNHMFRLFKIDRNDFLALSHKRSESVLSVFLSFSRPERTKMETKKETTTNCADFIRVFGLLTFPTESNRIIL